MRDETDKRARRRRIVAMNLALLALWIGTTFLQVEMYERGRDEFWMGDGWFGVYLLTALLGNGVTFQGSVLRRIGWSLLATLVLGLAWSASLAFCAHVLGITYA